MRTTFWLCSAIASTSELAVVSVGRLAELLGAVAASVPIPLALPARGGPVAFAARADPASAVATGTVAALSGATAMPRVTPSGFTLAATRRFDSRSAEISSSRA